MTRPLRRMLSALGPERVAREEIERLAGDQAALRRVATLAARAAAPEEIFAAVAEELARLSGADNRGGAPVRDRRRRDRARLLERLCARRHRERGRNCGVMGSGNVR
jgi:hypothetical protein